jgi:hypothetical protein
MAAKIADEEKSGLGISAISLLEVARATAAGRM